MMSRDFRMIKVIVACALPIVLSGCSSQTGSCESFPHDYNITYKNFDNSKYISPKTPNIETAIATIERCYARYPYLGKRYKLTFSSSRKLTDNEIYLIFSLYGADDVRVAFKIDLRGNILKSYVYSMS